MMADLVHGLTNLLPSLATMNTKELVANIIALVILVITLVVNICIQIYIGILDYYEEDNLIIYGSVTYLNDSAYIFCVVLLLMLLIIYVCHKFDGIELLVSSLHRQIP
uniref:Uncharacterized protein n=1 Tax=Lactuca sativa TaxID=4236 RepID=A0A9R1VAY7_LACSA|nr:hypothetical protein LSAT_V11C600314290 [Lactuca sativa]